MLKSPAMMFGNMLYKKKKKMFRPDSCAIASVSVSISNNISNFGLPMQRHQLNNELSITAQNVIRLIDTSSIFSCMC